MNDEDELLDVKAACKLIGGSKPIHPATLYRGIQAGRYPPGIPVSPNVRRWRKQKLVAAIDELAVQREGEAA